MLVTPTETSLLKNNLSYHFWMGCSFEQISKLGNIPIEKVNEILRSQLEIPNLKFHFIGSMDSTGPLFLLKFFDFQ